MCVYVCMYVVRIRFTLSDSVCLINYLVLIFNLNVVDIHIMLVSGILQKDVVLHLLWNDHSYNSSSHLFQYIVIAVLLTIFLLLYIIPLWLIYDITGGL